MLIFSSANCKRTPVTGPVKGRVYSLSGGFTLLEVLAVMVIISVMAGITVINLPAFTLTDTFDQEADRLKVLFAMLRDEATIQSTEFGFRVERVDAGERYAYSFHLYDESSRTWRLYTEPPFRPHTLPPGIRLLLSVENQDLHLPVPDEQDDLDDGGDSSEEDKSPPPVLVLSSGEVTQFSLLFENLDYQESNRVLTTDGFGDIDWQESES